MLGIVCGWRVLGWLLLMASAAVAGEPVSKEYQLKAAFLYNFTKFVEWSPSSFGAPDSPVVIGVLGSDPFGDELQNVVRGRKVNGREISVKRLQTTAGAKGVHLLFITAGEDALLADIQAGLRGASVLTVGESEAFGRSGGVIIFVIEGDKVRFDINIAAAEQAAVKISAQLQKLARSVRK